MRTAAIQRGLRTLAALTLLLASGCKSPTPEDEARLRMLETRFGSDFTFEFETFDIYLKARSRSQNVIPQATAEAIYREFWFTESGHVRKDTSYVYLNIYNREGVFQYQLWWDQNTG